MSLSSKKSLGVRWRPIYMGDFNVNVLAIQSASCVWKRRLAMLDIVQMVFRTLPVISLTEFDDCEFF